MRWVGLVGLVFGLVACSSEKTTAEDELDCTGEATSGWTGVSDWPADLSELCPEQGSQSFEIYECGGYKVVHRSLTIDVWQDDYYSAQSGKFVAAVVTHLSGGRRTCSGPDVFVVPKCETAWTPVSCETITPG